jgi:hypothetical protein
MWPLLAACSCVTPVYEGPVTTFFGEGGMEDAFQTLPPFGDDAGAPPDAFAGVISEDATADLDAASIDSAFEDVAAPEDAELLLDAGPSLDAEPPVEDVFAPPAPDAGP